MIYIATLQIEDQSMEIIGVFDSRIDAVRRCRDTEAQALDDYCRRYRVDAWKLGAAEESDTQFYYSNKTGVNK